MIMWTVLSWVFLPFLALKYGVNGAALGYSLVGVSSVVAIYVAKRYVNFSLIESVLRPLSAALSMGIVLFILKNFLASSFLSLGILVFAGIVVYAISIYFIVGVSIMTDVKTVFKIFRNED